MPFLIDLHVFLGRKFIPSTKRTGTVTDGVFGGVPQASYKTNFHGSQLLDATAREYISSINSWCIGTAGRGARERD